MKRGKDVSTKAREILARIETAACDAAHELLYLQEQGVSFCSDELRGYVEQARADATNTTSDVCIVVAEKMLGSADWVASIMGDAVCESGLDRDELLDELTRIGDAAVEQATANLRR